MLQQPVPAFTSGSREQELSDVQRLMDKLDYPAALRLLAQIQRDHPDQRDETQRLILLIISTQGQKYNEVLGRLVHVLYDEGDEVKASELVDQLHRLDPTRSTEEARKAMGYIKFLRLMNEAAGRLGEKKYVEALSLYLLPILDPTSAGFDLEKPSFDRAEYGDLVKQNVRQTMAGIVDNSRNASRDVLALRGVATSADALLAQPATAESPARLDAALLPLTLIMKKEAAVRAASSNLLALNGTLGDSGKLRKGDAYVQYLIWLSTGRKNKPPEGIAEAIRGLWQTDAVSIAQTAVDASTAGLAAARKIVDSGNPSGADSLLDQAYVRGLMAVKASVLAGGAIQPGADWSFSDPDLALLKTVVPLVSAGQENAEEALGLKSLIVTEKALAGLPAMPPGTAPTALTDLRVRSAKLSDEIQALGAAWEERVDSLRQQQDAGFPLAPLVSSASAMAARFSALSARVQGRDMEYALALATDQAGALQTQFAGAQTKRQKGQDSLNGTIAGRPPAQDVFVERNPGEALQFFDAARSDLDGVTAGLSGFRQQWQHERSAISASREMTAMLGSLNSLEQRVVVEKSELDRLSQIAQDQHRAALAKRKEADLAFADASRAFTAKQYDAAKLQLDDSRDLYLDSLLLEENVGVRKRYTVEIPSLIDRINQAIVEKYIADVDAQVASGRALFSQGEFLKSFLILESAQARWKATLGDRPNTDLDNLMEKVRNALRVSGGRDLSPDDSRAPAVNGFLSLANAKVAQADKLRKDDPQRTKLLDDAYGNVLSALDLAPVYRTAKALQLRIRKMEAPNDSTFRAEAGNEIAGILAEYRNKKGQPERLYFALKDYQDILPGYPGLQDAIQNLEIELGFRIRPPSTTDIESSNENYAQAVSLYDPGNSMTYDPSLRILDASISLNPGNARAIALRRAILLKQGSPEASAISQADLARFAEGKRLYNTEDYAGAYQILQGLMTGNKRNASYPPIAQLYLLTQQKLGLR